MTQEADLERRVLAALAQVIDPELGCSIVDLGLIYSVNVLPDRVRVLMTTTTPGCPAASFLQEGVRTAVLALEKTARVDVDLTYEPAWSAALMSAKAKKRFRVNDHFGKGHW